MDRKTLLHHLPSCRIGRYSFGENVMKDVAPILMFMAGVLFLAICYATQPAQEDIKPEPIYQVSK
jgi:hypothetical protein